MAHKYYEAKNVADRLENWAIKYNEVANWVKGHDILS